MKIALIAPPFIPVPPVTYGGTELFIADLAVGLQRLGHDVVVYANGESSVACEVRWLYPEHEWPLQSATSGTLKSLDHMAWSIADARDGFDIVHLNDALGISLSRFVRVPLVHTLHHPHDETLSGLYRRFQDIWYVAISRFQRQLEPMPRTHVIHHGVNFSDCRFVERKEPYLSFLGRMAPCKGPHLAIEVAKRTGIPLKLAGEVQPAFRDYWENDVKPHVDGRLIEYVGEVDQVAKADLLSRSRALLFPIQWDEPFGLVMIEAMACGTPVLALPGGSVDEVVENGRSGWICRDVDELARRSLDCGIRPASCREWVEERFSLDRMVRDYEALYRRAVDGQAVVADSDLTCDASRVI